ncbi:MAG: IMP dehydrogenase [Verrucomicrobiales bacterium]
MRRESRRSRISRQFPLAPPDDAAMVSMDTLPLSLSFDDVLLLPQRSGILPGEADVRTRLTSEINLNIPVLSSAMDTVTEAELAIALAREGGLGVVHRAMPVEDQASMIARVKRSENMVIQKPFTVPPEMTLRGLRRFMVEKGALLGFPGRGCGGSTGRDGDQPRHVAAGRRRRKSRRFHDAARAPGHRQTFHDAGGSGQHPLTSTASKSCRWWMTLAIWRV